MTPQRATEILINLDLEKCGRYTYFNTDGSCNCPISYLMKEENITTDYWTESHDGCSINANKAEIRLLRNTDKLGLNIEELNELQIRNDHTDTMQELKDYIKFLYDKYHQEV